MGRDELKAYRELIGAEAYRKLYNYLYLEAKTKKSRFSGEKYENSPEKLKQIKEKYKNGVSKETINQMLGIKECEK